MVVGAAGDQLVAALGQRGADRDRVGADLPRAAPPRPSAVAGRRANTADAGGTAAVYAQHVQHGGAAPVGALARAPCIHCRDKPC